MMGVIAIVTVPAGKDMYWICVCQCCWRIVELFIV